MVAQKLFYRHKSASEICAHYLDTYLCRYGSVLPPFYLNHRQDGTMERVPLPPTGPNPHDPRLRGVEVSEVCFMWCIFVRFFSLFCILHAFVVCAVCCPILSCPVCSFFKRCRLLVFCVEIWCINYPNACEIWSLIKSPQTYHAPPAHIPSPDKNIDVFKQKHPGEVA